MDLSRHRFDQLRRRLERRLTGDDYHRTDGQCRQAPEWLVLVVNNFCNLRCKMCDVGVRESESVFFAHLVGDDPRNMPLELLEEILDQAARFSPKPRIGLSYTEPLIHKDVVAFCRAIVERGFFCAVTTNGYTLARLADELVDAGLHDMTVSVDGPEEVHDRVRGRRGSFRKLYEGVERVNEAKRRRGASRPVMRFSYTLTDENSTHMLDFVRQVEGLAPASYCFSHLNFITEEMAGVHNARFPGEWAVSRSNLGPIDPGAIDLDAMWRALVDLKAYAASRPGFPDLLIVPDVGSVAGLETYYRQPLRFIGGRSCTDPWRMMMIRTDGTVIPAHGRCYNVPVGRVTETALPELWNHQRFRSFRQVLKGEGGALPGCTRCCGVINKPGSSPHVPDGTIETPYP